MPSASTYTLTRDIHCTSVTINNGVTVKTANYRIFCRGTITNNGTISNNGNNALGQLGWRLGRRGFARPAAGLAGRAVPG